MYLTHLQRECIVSCIPLCLVVLVNGDVPSIFLRSTTISGLEQSVEAMLVQGRLELQSHQTSASDDS